jgi:Xaa-Pro aminopeptidase
LFLEGIYVCPILSSVASGPNSAILHYEANVKRVDPGDLVLVDAGAEYRGYTADISRTFPASSTYSLAQRDVYNTVLAAQVQHLEV